MHLREVLRLMAELFRGVRAPASLKPRHHWRSHQHRHVLFRGVRAPASLKRDDQQAIRDDQFLFRGVRAPASLKRDHRAGHGRPDGNPLFRGVRAPASLKLGAGAEGRRGTRPRRALPGRTRPGLIEASGRPPPGGRAPTALPGRTRPGLIEAGPRCRCSPRRWFLFRGVRAPASLKLGHGADAVRDAGSSSGAYAPRPH